VTETDGLAAALDAASARWPGLSRAQLIARLALHGHQALANDQQERSRARREVIERHAGALTGAYGEDYLRDLRQDWPT
jgi:hypothetical protein